MKSEDQLAAELAARFYQIMREEAQARGAVSMFLPFLPWEEADTLTREGMTAVVARVMREAREQREDWTRSFIDSEAARLRESIELRDPDALRKIGAPVPGRLTRLRDGFEPLTAGFRERVPAEIMTGAEFDRLKSLDARVRQARYELFRLAERKREQAQNIAGTLQGARLLTFIFEFETILVRFGLAPAPEDFPGLTTLEIEGSDSAAFEDLLREYKQLASVDLQKLLDFELTRKAGRRLLAFRDRLRTDARRWRDLKQVAHVRGATHVREDREAFAKTLEEYASEILATVRDCKLTPPTSEGSDPQ